MTYLLSSHFSFYLHDKLSVIISKIHHESILQKNSSKFLDMNLIEVYWKVDTLKFDNVNVKHGFTFLVHLL
jgi:hypothetical protein